MTDPTPASSPVVVVTGANGAAPDLPGVEERVGAFDDPGSAAGTPYPSRPSGGSMSTTSSS